MANIAFQVTAALLFQIENVIDAEGDQAQLASPIQWNTSDSTILNPTPATDGLSATGTALKTGTVTITATDANGVTSSVAITVTSGQAVSFSITVSLAPPPTPPSTTPAGGATA